MDEQQDEKKPAAKPVARKPATKHGGMSVETPVARIDLPPDVSTTVAPGVLFFFYCLGVCVIMLTVAYCWSLIWNRELQPLPPLPEPAELHDDLLDAPQQPELPPL